MTRLILNLVCAGFAVTLAVCPPAVAEYAVYGDVILKGLSRDSSWNNTTGTAYSMVCNVNGPDGFVTIRACPSSDCAIRRQLRRLAIIEVDTRLRQGHWVFVTTAYRQHSEDGYMLFEAQFFPVEGWVYDQYLCDMRT